MSCTCETYQCLAVDYNTCSNGVELPINADETASWSVLIEFNGTWIRLSVDVVDEEPIVIPNILNERYVHTIRLLRANKDLFNNTCYRLQTGYVNSNTIVPSGSGNPYKETYRLDFTVSDETGQTFTGLIGSELLSVNIETNDIETAALNTNTGLVTWNSSVGIGQTGYILYKK